MVRSLSSNFATNQHRFNHVPLLPRTVCDQTFEPFAPLRRNQAARSEGTSKTPPATTATAALMLRKPALNVDKETEGDEAAKAAVEQEMHRCAATEQASWSCMTLWKC